MRRLFHILLTIMLLHITLSIDAQSIVLPTKRPPVTISRPKSVPKAKPAKKKAEHSNAATVRREASRPIVTRKETSAKKERHASVREVNSKKVAAPKEHILNELYGPLDYAEEMPTFPGGLSSYFAENLEYPSAASTGRKRGSVVIQVIITREGYIRDPKIVESVDPYLDDEALRVVSNMPRWNPGKQDGIPVDVYYDIYVPFK